MIRMRQQSWTEDRSKIYGCVIVRECQGIGREGSERTFGGHQAFVGFAGKHGEEAEDIEQEILVCVGHRLDQPLICRDGSFSIGWLSRYTYPIRNKIFPLLHGRRTERLSELHWPNRNRKTDQRLEPGKEKGTYREIKVMWYHRLLKVTKDAHLSERRTARHAHCALVLISVGPRTGIMIR